MNHKTKRKHLVNARALSFAGYRSGRVAEKAPKARRTEADDVFSARANSSLRTSRPAIWQRLAACTQTASSYFSSSGRSWLGSGPRRSSSLDAYVCAELNLPSPSPSIQIGFVAPITRDSQAGEEGWYGRAIGQYGAVTPGPDAMATK